MKHFLLVPLLAILTIGSVAYGQIFFNAKMDSVQEIPAPTGRVPGVGIGAFILNSNATQLYYNITVDGLSGPLTAGHFHDAAAGVAGGVVKTLTFVNNHAVGVWSSTDATQPLTDSLLSELLDGRLYVNVHTTANPGGEIRGQVLLKSGVGFTAMLDSAQETPAPVGSVPGTGTLWVTLGTNGQITYGGTVTGLSGAITASHFHAGAVGVAGGVVKGVSFTGTAVSGTWTTTDATQPLTDLLLRDLVKGNLYFNVHTSANPGGEIRGQVLVNNGSSAFANMDSVQELPAPVGLVPGKGTGSFWLNSAGTTLYYSVTVDGLSGPLSAGHFHDAAAGTAGGVVKTLSFVNNTATGSWSTTDASQPWTDSMLTEFLHGRLYVNVHTTANPGGEIRGQVTRSTGIGFSADMDSAQEVPAPVGLVPGKGTFSVGLLTDGSISYEGAVTGLSGPLTAGHFHDAQSGVAGGVVKSLSFANDTANGEWTSSDASQPLTDMLLRELIAGRLYVNVHTTANPGGEIRGQVANSGSAVTSVVEQLSKQVPLSFQLDQNYPNPFNPSTTISFALQTSGRVTLKIYNILGQQVAVLLDAVKSPGVYRVTFDASTLSSGVYFYRLTTGAGISEAKKMVLMK
ncbi:MAG: CHRD domain-containing protein [Bacteroidota bacterium]